jgi:hypothetical protein
MPDLSKLGPGMVQHVRPDGDDNLSGWDWINAKRHVAAAAKGFPPLRPNHGPDHFRSAGYINVAPGEYIEIDLPIECNAHLSVVGMGLDEPPFGTRIKMGKPMHMFAPKDFTGWGHGIDFYNLVLDGSLIEPTDGAWDLVRCRRGGFGTIFNKVHFRGATGAGLRQLENSVNCVMFNCMGSGCKGPWLHFSLSSWANTCSLSLIANQVDNCGTNETGAIQIDDEAHGDCNNIGIWGFEFEGSHDQTMQRVIAYNGGGHNPTWFTVDAITAWRNRDERPEAQGERVVFWDPNGRAKGRFTNIHGSGYDKAVKGGSLADYESQKYESQDHHLIMGIRGRGSTWTEW